MKKILLATTLFMSSGLIFADGQSHEHKAEHSHAEKSMEQMDTSASKGESMKENVKRHEHKSQLSQAKKMKEHEKHNLSDDKLTEKMEKAEKEKTHDHTKMK